MGSTSIEIARVTTVNARWFDTFSFETDQTEKSQTTVVLLYLWKTAGKWKMACGKGGKTTVALFWCAVYVSKAPRGVGPHCCQFNNMSHLQRENASNTVQSWMLSQCSSIKFNLFLLFAGVPLQRNRERENSNKTNPRRKFKMNFVGNNSVGGWQVNWICSVCWDFRRMGQHRQQVITK